MGGGGEGVNSSTNRGRERENEWSKRDHKQRLFIHDKQDSRDRSTHRQTIEREEDRKERHNKGSYDAKNIYSFPPASAPFLGFPSPSY